MSNQHVKKIANKQELLLILVIRYIHYNARHPLQFTTKMMSCEYFYFRTGRYWHPCLFLLCCWRRHNITRFWCHLPGRAALSSGSPVVSPSISISEWHPARTNAAASLDNLDIGINIRLSASSFLVPLFVSADDFIDDDETDTRVWSKLTVTGFMTPTELIHLLSTFLSYRISTHQASLPLAPWMAQYKRFAISSVS